MHARSPELFTCASSLLSFLNSQANVSHPRISAASSGHCSNVYEDESTQWRLYLPQYMGR